MQDMGPYRLYRSRKALTARLFRPPWVSSSILATVSGQRIPWARPCRCCVVRTTEGGVSSWCPAMWTRVLPPVSEDGPCSWIRCSAIGLGRCRCRAIPDSCRRAEEDPASKRPDPMAIVMATAIVLAVAARLPQEALDRAFIVGCSWVRITKQRDSGMVEKGSENNVV